MDLIGVVALIATVVIFCIGAAEGNISWRSIQIVSAIFAVWLMIVLYLYSTAHITSVTLTEKINATESYMVNGNDYVILHPDSIICQVEVNISYVGVVKTKTFVTDMNDRCNDITALDIERIKLASLEKL